MDYKSVTKWRISIHIIHYNPEFAIWGFGYLKKTQLEIMLSCCAQLYGHKTAMTCQLLFSQVAHELYWQHWKNSDNQMVRPIYILQHRIIYVFFVFYIFILPSNQATTKNLFPAPINLFNTHTAKTCVVLWARNE